VARQKPSHSAGRLIRAQMTAGAQVYELMSDGEDDGFDDAGPRYELRPSPLQSRSVSQDFSRGNVTFGIGGTLRDTLVMEADEPDGGTHARGGYAGEQLKSTAVHKTGAAEADAGRKPASVLRHAPSARDALIMEAEEDQGASRAHLHADGQFERGSIPRTGAAATDTGPVRTPILKRSLSLRDSLIMEADDIGEGALRSLAGEPQKTVAFK
jgi:hypothetical protein